MAGQGGKREKGRVYWPRKIQKNNPQPPGVRKNTGRGPATQRAGPADQREQDQPELAWSQETKGGNGGQGAAPPEEKKTSEKKKIEPNQSKNRILIK